MSNGLSALTWLCFSPFPSLWGQDMHHARGQDHQCLKICGSRHSVALAWDIKWSFTVLRWGVSLYCEAVIKSAHEGIFHQESEACLCKTEIAMNSPNNWKTIPHLGIYLQVMIWYALFFRAIFPEGLQPSSGFPRCGTSCVKVVDEEMWGGL